MGAEAVAAAVSERFPQAASAAQAGPRPEPTGGEFVVFSKPELGRLNRSDLAAVWDLFAAAFAAYDVTVHRVKIMTGPELDRAGAMQQHYGVINQISRLGRPALTEAAEESLRGLLADAPDGHRGARRPPVSRAVRRGQPVRAGHAVRQRPGQPARPRHVRRPGPDRRRDRGHPERVPSAAAELLHRRRRGVRLPARQQPHRLGGAAVRPDRRHRPEQGCRPVSSAAPCTRTRRRSV